MHQYLLDCQDTYTEASQLLEGYGYVEEWNSSVSFRIGYPELGVGGEGRPAIPAGGWSVEAFMLNGKQTSVVLTMGSRKHMIANARLRRHTVALEKALVSG